MILELWLTPRSTCWWHWHDGWNIFINGRYFFLFQCFMFLLKDLRKSGKCQGLCHILVVSLSLSLFSFLLFFASSFMIKLKKEKCISSQKKRRERQHFTVYSKNSFAWLLLLLIPFFSCNLLLAYDLRLVSSQISVHSRISVALCSASFSLLRHLGIFWVISKSVKVLSFTASLMHHSLWKLSKLSHLMTSTSAFIKRVLPWMPYALNSIF